jgi:transcription elongation GreA/GreB family factor
VKPDKATLRTELVAQLTAQLATAQAAHAAAIEGATHAEAKPENDKDTRGLEQSYLARGQAQRVAELEAAVAETTKLALRTFAGRDPVAITAVVSVDEDRAEHRFFLVPHGGGNVLAGNIQVVTPTSPLGRALLGKKIDDEIEVVLPGKTRSLTITAIA